MSSILKALKKVEGESPRLDVSPTLPQKIDTKRAVNQRVRGTWLFNRVLTVVVVVVILGVGTWFVFGNQDLWVRKERSVPPVASKPAVETQAASLQPDAKDVNREPMKEIVREAAPKVPAPSSEKAARVEPVQREETPLVNSPTKPGRPAGAENTRPQGVDASSGGQSDEARYKLEAIVWSNNSESRFAVINGQIVRAGGAVGGLSVLEIGRDHLAVRSAGRDWKMKFTVE